MSPWLKEKRTEEKLIGKEKIEKARSMHDLLVISDAFLWKMLTSPVWTSSFAFLVPYASQAKAIVKQCKCSSPPPKGINLGEIKRTIANLPAEAKLKFKSLAKAKQVRVIYRNSSDRIIKLTF